MPSTTSIKVGDFFSPECPYADKCSSKGIKCQSCGHRKKDYYVPEYPFIWTTPKGSPQPTVTFCISSSDMTCKNFGMGLNQSRR